MSSSVPSPGTTSESVPTFPLSAMMVTRGEDEGEDALRRRRRVILKNFYGSPDTVQEKQAAPNPTNIDDATFDSSRYFERLLRSHGVRRLLKADQVMLRDIKKLDSDMKTLVYENYNKFICATDTIRDMKKKVEDMEEEMQLLTTHMEAITHVSDTIDHTLAPRRSRRPSPPPPLRPSCCCCYLAHMHGPPLRLVVDLSGKS